MILLRLFFEFFKTGLFAVGGGLATIPFLRDMGVRTGWFADTDLTTMIAVSESTPGPIGVNMATYVGFTVAGVPSICLETGPGSRLLLARALRRWAHPYWIPVQYGRCLRFLTD